MLALGGLMLSLAGCSGAARITGQPPSDLSLPPGMEVAFNHRVDRHYRSPVSGLKRNGDNLEQMLLDTIARAQREILVAVQELSLPEVSRALVAKQHAGVSVKVVLENTYSRPWSEEHPVDLDSRQRSRHHQLKALADSNRDGVLSLEERQQGDAVALLRRGGVPLLDDTADGSAGSGLMHHKFLVVDGRWVVTGSANFTPSCIHGDLNDGRTRGNANHLLRIDSRPLATVFNHEFSRLWGDGPGGLPNSRFGIGKDNGDLQQVMVGPTKVEVLFAPHRRRDPRNGLALIETELGQAQQRLDLNLFVFSAQNLANRIAQLHQQGVRIRVLADPGFATRSFSEVLDLLGLAMADHRCKREAGNAPLAHPLAGVGTPRLARGDKLHHKVAVIDDRSVITGSFNWSPSAAHGNDETLMIIRSPQLAAHFNREMDQLWQGAELGLTPRLQRKLQQSRQRCGTGEQRS